MGVIQIPIYQLDQNIKKLRSTKKLVFYFFKRSTILFASSSGLSLQPLISQ